MIPLRWLTLMLLSALTCTAAVPAAEKPLVVDVWPGSVPGEPAQSPPERFLPDQAGVRRVQRLTDVSRPTLTVFRAPKEKDTGAAVVIAPGGGYSILAWDLEGEEVAAWLNSIGVTGILLKYRVPRRPDQKEGPPAAPLQDAQRAVSLVRSKATEWGIDPARIGMLGFSAGGHLTASAATNWDRRAYSPMDAVDQVSARPDFTVLVYPAYLTGKEPGSLSPEIRVTEKTPPSFLAHAGDDRIGPENSIAYYLALKRAAVPAELHVYASGGHGFGLRPTEHAVTAWPDRCEAWMRGQGLLKAK